MVSRTFVSFLLVIQLIFSPLYPTFLWAEEKPQSSALQQLQEANKKALEESKAADEEALLEDEGIVSMAGSYTWDLAVGLPQYWLSERAFPYKIMDGAIAYLIYRHVTRFNHLRMQELEARTAFLPEARELLKEPLENYSKAVKDFNESITKLNQEAKAGVYENLTDLAKREFDKLADEAKSAALAKDSKKAPAESIKENELKLSETEAFLKEKLEPGLARIEETFDKVRSVVEEPRGVRFLVERSGGRLSKMPSLEVLYKDVAGTLAERISLSLRSVRAVGIVDAELLAYEAQLMESLGHFKKSAPWWRPDQRFARSYLGSKVVSGIGKWSNVLLAAGYLVGATWLSRTYSRAVSNAARGHAGAEAEIAVRESAVALEAYQGNAYILQGELKVLAQVWRENNLNLPAPFPIADTEVTMVPNDSVSGQAHQVFSSEALESYKGIRRMVLDKLGADAGAEEFFAKVYETIFKGVASMEPVYDKALKQIKDPASYFAQVGTRAKSLAQQLELQRYSTPPKEEATPQGGKDGEEE